MNRCLCCLFCCFSDYWNKCIPYFYILISLIKTSQCIVWNFLYELKCVWWNCSVNLSRNYCLKENKSSRNISWKEIKSGKHFTSFNSGSVRRPCKSSLLAHYLIMKSQIGWFVITDDIWSLSFLMDRIKTIYTKFYIIIIFLIIYPFVRCP